MSSLKQQISFIHNKNLGDIKGTQSAMGQRWPGHYFYRFEKGLLQQMFASDKFRNPLQSCLVFHSILDLWMIPSFPANFYSSCNIILPYLVKHSIQRNMKRIDFAQMSYLWFRVCEKKKGINFITITAHFLSAGSQIYRALLILMAHRSASSRLRFHGDN